MISTYKASPKSRTLILRFPKVRFDLELNWSVKSITLYKHKKGSLSVRLIDFKKRYSGCFRLAWTELDYIEWRKPYKKEFAFYNPAKNNWTARFWFIEFARTQLPF